MRSPAFALGWELWARHRRGLTAILIGAVVAIVLVQVLPTGSTTEVVGSVSPLLTLLIYVYLSSVFTYSENPLDTRGVGFPLHLLTLPVRTSLLVAWPMIYGTVTVACLWLGLVWLILVPCHLMRTAEWWPALLLAACLAWFQAICWVLVRAPLLRLVMAVVGLPSVVLWCAFFWATYDLKITLTHLTVGLSAAIITAYAVAVLGVSRDRRGDRLNWAWVGQLALRAVPRLPGEERPFASPMAAQRWLELRRYSWLLLTFVGLFLVMLFWSMAFHLRGIWVRGVAVAVVCISPLLALFVGFGMGKTGFWTSSLHLSAFIATRPLSSIAIARAKLYAAACSTLATWALVLILVPVWVILTGNVKLLFTLRHVIFDDQSGGKFGLLATLALVGLIGLTWLQLVGGICLGLTGRAWVVNGATLVYVATGTALFGLGAWTIVHPGFSDTLLIVLWCLGGTLALLKLGVVVWTGSRPGFWNDRAVPWFVLLWLAIAACLVVPLYAVAPNTDTWTHLLALFVLLSLPLTRLTALPLAVAWNRHR